MSSTTNPKPPIGFCGLGAMGLGMATHLVKSSYPVTGFDLYPPSLEKFAAAGGTPCTSLSESARDKPIYIVMVATHLQAQAAIFGSEEAGQDKGILSTLPQGAVLFLCSTVPAAYAQGLEKELKDRGRGDVYFIDAPVSGGAIRAADGTLSIMAGASDAALAKGQEILEVLTAPKKLFLVKGGIGAGSNMKMAHQVLAAIHILATSEAFGFAVRLGLDAREFRDEVVKSRAWSWMFENRSVRTLNGDWYPGASMLTIILKDTGIITSSARLLDFPVPLCSAAEQVYLSGLDRGYGSHDDSSLIRLWCPDPVQDIASGLSPADKQAKTTIVLDYLQGLFLVSAAEALGFGHHVGLPLAQLYELAADAAGGSAVFKELGPSLIDALEGRGTAPADIVADARHKLKVGSQEAQKIKCPLYLGNAALNLLNQTGKKPGLAALLDLYTVA